MSKLKEYGSFWERLSAFCIDSIILFVFFYVLDFSIIIHYKQFTFTFIAIMYSAFMESSKKQGTIGKIMLGLKVTDLDKKKISFIQALLRQLGIMLSGMILGIGFLLIFTTEKKQALHDLILKTIVIKK